MLYAPESPRSSFSASTSTLSSSPPKLDTNTLALLDSFLSSKAEEERRFNELAEQAAARVAKLALDLDIDAEVEDEEEAVKPMMSVDEYRLAFGEDWQLSQFWYSTRFATRLARHVRDQCPSEESTVAFLCCPTAFVAFQHTNPLKGARLLEYDQRFAVLAPKQYVQYDIEEPDLFPEDLRGSVDIAVVDPPFLNRITNERVVKTLLQLLHPTRGKLLMITSTSVEPILKDLYSEAPLGPLRKMALEVEHGRLANDFACYGSWEGAEEVGKVEADSNSNSE